MRLIDADALEKGLKESYKALIEYQKGLSLDEERRVCDARLATFREFVVRIHKAPTVNIKTEVAREIFEEIEENSECYNDYGDYYIDHGIFNFLKNKYTKEGVGE